MAVFHALMLVCSLVTETAGECDVYAGPGSPFPTQEECLKTTKEGHQVIKEDAEISAALEAGAVDVRFVCHEAEEGYVLEEHKESLIKLYGPPQGEKI
jgi:hypothetical protein